MRSRKYVWLFHIIINELVFLRTNDNFDHIDKILKSEDHG